MPSLYTEADYEQSVMELFSGMNYEIVYGPDVERDLKSPLYDDVLEDYIHRLNPDLPEDAIADAMFKLRNFENGELVKRNEVFMDYLQNGVPVRYVTNGEERSSIAYLVDYDHPDNNSFIAANQWTHREQPEAPRCDFVFEWAAHRHNRTQIPFPRGNRRQRSLPATSELYAGNSFHVYL